jgi:hypothetical protein
MNAIAIAWLEAVRGLLRLTVAEHLVTREEAAEAFAEAAKALLHTGDISDSFEDRVHIAKVLAPHLPGVWADYGWLTTSFGKLGITASPIAIRLMMPKAGLVIKPDASFEWEFWKHDPEQRARVWRAARVAGWVREEQEVEA